MYINVLLQSMKHRGTFNRIQCQDGFVLAVLSIDHTYDMLFCLLTTHTACPRIQATAGYAPAQSVAYLSYIGGGADTQLGSICISAPLATNVDLWNPIECDIMMLL